MSNELEKSQLVKLPSGQIKGHPVTRRELKRQLRLARLRRRAAFRAAKKNGVSNA